ncbi:MAG: hypothetical protein V1936_00985 [Patescibacteria group bacterium]
MEHKTTKIQPTHRNSLAKPALINGHLFPAGSQLCPNNLINTKRFGDIWAPSIDPTTWYLNLSEKLIPTAEELRKNLFEKNKFIAPDTGNENWIVDHKNYSKFIQNTTSIIIFLYTTLEAFSNQIIPIRKEYRIQTNRRNSHKPEFFESKQKVMRYLSLEDKLVWLAKELLYSDIKQQKFWGSFKNLTTLRNDLVHIKTMLSNAVDTHLDLYSQLIDADLKDLLLTTKNIITFFRPDFFDNQSDFFE